MSCLEYSRSVYSHVIWHTSSSAGHVSGASDGGAAVAFRLRLGGLIGLANRSSSPCESLSDNKITISVLLQYPLIGGTDSIVIQSTPWRGLCMALSASFASRMAFFHHIESGLVHAAGDSAATRTPWAQPVASIEGCFRFIGRGQGWKSRPNAGSERA